MNLARLSVAILAGLKASQEREDQLIKDVLEHSGSAGGGPSDSARLNAPKLPAGLRLSNSSLQVHSPSPLSLPLGRSLAL